MQHKSDRIMKHLEENEILTIGQLAMMTGIKEHQVRTTVNSMMELGQVALLDDDEVILCCAGSWSPSA